MRYLVYILMLVIPIITSCNKNSKSSKRERKLDSLRAILRPDSFNRLLKREKKWEDSLRVRVLTADSAIKGLRETLIYDTNGKRITKQEANALLLTGQYELKVVGIVDVRLSKKSKQQLDIEKREKPANSLKFPIHSIFPDFQTTDINQIHLSSKTFKGKLLVVNYWFLACGPCRAEMKDLNSIVDKYGGNAVNFISFTPDKKKEILQAANLNFKYKIIPDQQPLIAALGIDMFPTHVVIDKSGKVVFSCSESGPHVIYWLKKTIDSCLAAR
jgi:thiol-disulfide isomerase/thioredoxin